MDQFLIFPNPTTGSVNLRYSIYKQGITIFEVYEISGVRIRCLLNEPKMPGTYEIEIDLSNLNPGIYFCLLKASEGIQTRKIIKL